MDDGKSFRLEALTCGGLSPENYQYWNEKRKEEEERIQREAVEQRKLDAKLASERIQEKAKQKAEENQKRAQQFKEEVIKLTFRVISLDDSTIVLIIGVSIYTQNVFIVSF